MNTSPHIAINGLFLRKPGVGIGEVTKNFLQDLAAKEDGVFPYIVYVDDAASVCDLGPTGKILFIKPWWQRDDLIRKMLWEHIQLPKRALSDKVTLFLSLYQAPTEFPKDIQQHHAGPRCDTRNLSGIHPKLRNKWMWNMTRRAITQALM